VKSKGCGNKKGSFKPQNMNWNLLTGAALAGKIKAQKARVLSNEQ
jgi:hypothetical protein